MKNHTYLGSLVLFLLLAYHRPLSAQSDWQEINSNEGVTVSYQIDACHGQTYLALQVVNTNNQPVNLNYEILLPNSNGESVSITTPKHLFVEAAQTLTGSCTDPNPELYILLFDEFTNPERVEITLATRKL